MNDSSDIPHPPPDEPTPKEPTPSDPATPQPSHELLWRVDDSAVDWDLPARFELQRDLGDGPAGPMFLVRDLERERRMSRLEIVSGARAPQAKERDAIEAQLRAVAALDSMHLARALEVGRLGDGRVFALYEHVEGESLATRLAREGALHPTHALEIARQVLLAIEALHGAELDHGELTPDSVWLESHVAKTDDNPFGVRVSVLAAGIAPPSDARGLGKDMRGVGEILSTTLGLAHGTGELEDAARSLAHAMRADVERPLAHAESARRAVERLLARPRADANSSAPRESSGSRRLTLAAIALALAMLTWVAWNVRHGTEAATRAADNERARFLSTQNDMLARVRNLRAELAEGESTLRARLGEFESALRAEGAVVEVASSAEEQTRAELERQRGAVSELTQRLETKRLELETVQARLAEALSLSERSVHAARGLDALLELLASDQGARAAERARTLEAEGLMGLRTEFVSSLASSFEQLGRFETSRRSGAVEALDVAAVDAASKTLARATEQQAAFLDEAAEWVALKLANEPARPRAERVERTLELLQSRMRSANAERELAHSREWAALQSSPALAGPERALEHATRFGCRHVDEAGARFVRALRDVAVVDESIDAQQLSAVTGVGAWTSRVRGGEVRLDEDLARDLELLDAAQRWYERDDSLDSKALRVAQASIVGLRDHGTWRDQLGLQWRLAGEVQALALDVGRTAWRRDVDPSGAIEWWREVVENDDGDVRSVRRSRFTEDGKTELGEGVLRVERAGDRVRYVGCRASLLELRASGPAVEVAATPVADGAQLPPALALLSETRVALSSDSEGELCLVYTNGDVRRWISPRFGIVREETRTPLGIAVTQLVAFER